MQLDKFLNSTVNTNNRMMNGLIKKLLESKEAQQFEPFLVGRKDGSPVYAVNNQTNNVWSSSKGFHSLPSRSEIYSDPSRRLDPSMVIEGTVTPIATPYSK